MSFILPVASVSDPGYGPDKAPDEHMHKLFDEGAVLTLKSGWANVSSTRPLKIYKAADWVLLTGFITRTGATSAAEQSVADIEPQYVGSRPLDRLQEDVQKPLSIIQFTGAGALAVATLRVNGNTSPTSDDIGIAAPTNGHNYQITVEWRAI